MNSYDGPVDFKLPHTTAGPRWTLWLDTNAADVVSPDARFDFDSVYKVAGRSLVLFSSLEEGQ
jgi:glycogen operon protein